MPPFVYQKKNRGPRAGAEVCEVHCKRAACNIQLCIATLHPNFKGEYDYPTVIQTHTPDVGWDGDGWKHAQNKCQHEMAKFDRCCDYAIRKFGSEQEKAEAEAAKAAGHWGAQGTPDSN